MAANASRQSLADSQQAFTFDRTRDPDASTRPRVGAARLDIPVSMFSTGMNVALSRPPKIEVTQWGLEKPAKPKIVSLQMGRQPLRTISFEFPESPADAQPPSPAKAKQAAKKRPKNKQQEGASATCTRMRPPNDIIKLEDRLYYVLQPPLESIVSNSCVEFPFEPFPYQYEGVAFLYTRFAAILADEMGLGKTMQAITTIRLLLMAGEVRRVLLVCPKPLVTNWQREFAMWAPEVPLGVIEGDQERRRWQWEQPQTPVVVANYELLVRDHAIVNDENRRFDLVVLDEAQRIKNKSSTTSQVVRNIPRLRSWALTGTPVENSTEDLVGVFEFLSEGYLNANMQPRKMAKAVRDYILRRTKDMVLTDLPPKMYRDADLGLTPQQWETYRIAEDEGIVKLSEMGDELSIQHVFQLVLRLKQICNFDPLTGASSKLERLLADLEEVAASGQKAIVFSQWVQSLERIRESLGDSALEYHGKIPSKRRDAVLERFKNDDKIHVLLMSYGAGSVGLNLQFCRYVFLFDRWWNPAIEDQAINRAHRIGATGQVTVTRMLTLDTIEERINQVLEQKRELFDMILSQTGEPKNMGLTQDDIFGLFNLRTK